MKEIDKALDALFPKRIEANTFGIGRKNDIMPKLRTVEQVQGMGAFDHSAKIMQEAYAKQKHGVRFAVTDPNEIGKGNSPGFTYDYPMDDTAYNMKPKVVLNPGVPQHESTRNYNGDPWTYLWEGLLEHKDRLGHLKTLVQAHHEHQGSNPAEDLKMIDRIEWQWNYIDKVISDLKYPTLAHTPVKLSHMKSLVQPVLQWTAQWDRGLHQQGRYSKLSMVEAMKHMADAAVWYDCRDLGATDAKMAEFGRELFAAGIIELPYPKVALTYEWECRSTGEIVTVTEFYEMDRGDNGKPTLVSVYSIVQPEYGSPFIAWPVSMTTIGDHVWHTLAAMTAKVTSVEERGFSSGKKRGETKESAPAGAEHKVFYRKIVVRLNRGSSDHGGSEPGHGKGVPRCLHWRSGYLATLSSDFYKTKKGQRV